MTANTGSTYPEPPAFEVVEHTADWALHVTGRDLAALLTHAALGMSSLLVADLKTLPSDKQRRIELDAFDAETLLVDWLSELAYLAESEQLVFSDFDLSEVTANRMTAVIRGGRPAELLKHIKAVTYHDLAIKQTARGLEATIVFDV